MEYNGIDGLAQWTTNVREKLLGILFTLLTAVSFTTGDILLYTVIQDFHPCLIFVFNSTICFILCFLLVITLKPSFPATSKQFLLVILHGSLNCVTQLTIATAIFSIGPGSAIALFFTVPIFTTIYSVLFMRTKHHDTKFFFALCSTLGVTLLTRYLTIIDDQTLNENLSVVVGVANAIAGAMAYAGGLIVGHKLADLGTHPLINVLSYSFQYSMVAIVLCLGFNAWEAPKTLSSLASLIGTGLSTLCAMLFSYLAICYEKPTTVSIILTSEVIMTFIGQYVMFSFPFHWTVPVGSMLIVLSSVGILLFESRNVEDNDQENVNDDESYPIVEQ